MVDSKKGSTKSKMAQTVNKYENSDRAVFLRTWCNEKGGRTSALAKHVFDHCPGKSNSMSHYKYGRFDIKDWMWEKIQAGVKLVEQDEKENAPKQTTQLEFSAPVEDMDAYNKAASYFMQYPGELLLFSNVMGRTVDIEEFKTDSSLSASLESYQASKDDLNVTDAKVSAVNTWLGNDRARKLRLANVIYVHNFVKGQDKDYTSSYFSTVIKQIEQGNFVVTNFDRVEAIMTKVDKMIADNHPFAVAAGRVVNVS